MATYKEDYQKAKEKGKTTQVTVEIYTWDTEGQELVGKLLDILPFTEGKFDTEVKKYIIETDAGRISTVLGAATDKRIERVIKPGDMMYIKWNGQKELAGGNHVNLFEVSTWR